MPIVTSMVAGALSIGVFCLLVWLPRPILRIIFRHVSETKIKLRYILGAIGTICYLVQLGRLTYFGVELPPQSAPIAANLAFGVIILAVVMFGICSLNFLLAVFHGFLSSSRGQSETD